VLTAQRIHAQQDVPPQSNRSGVLVPVTFKFQVPAGDLSDRFGVNSAVAVGLMYKYKNNWIIGTEGSFFFGNRVKETSLLESYVFTSSGNIVGSNGYPTDIFFYERGYDISFKVGKLIPLLKNNKDSGLFLQAGGGFMSHKIFISLKDFAVPFLTGDYAKGIDRLTNGISFSQQIGYLHLDKKKLTNINLGFEIIEAFTKNRRSYNFDEMRADDKLRLDIFLGIRLSIILPIYNQTGDYFYN